MVGENSSPSPPSFCTVNHTLLVRVVEVPTPDLSAASACSTIPGAPGAGPVAGPCAAATPGTNTAPIAQLESARTKTPDNDGIWASVLELADGGVPTRNPHDGTGRRSVASQPTRRVLGASAGVA